MGVLSGYLADVTAKRVLNQDCVVFYDHAGVFEPWIDRLKVTQGPAEPDRYIETVNLAGKSIGLAVFSGSYYQLIRECEARLSNSQNKHLLIYIGKEPHLEHLSPLRELECLGGEREPFQPRLEDVARRALQDAGLDDAKIDELVEGKDLTFEYVDGLVAGDSDAASPFAPIFGSGREGDVFSGFLLEGEKREEVANRGLIEDLVTLSQRSLGLPLATDVDVNAIADQLVRFLLVTEMRSDLSGPEPVEISEIPRAESEEQQKRARMICARLRRDAPEIYQQLATKVESDLGFAGSSIDPATLGMIDTFPFEERRLLAACSDWLCDGHIEQALQTAQDRRESFWTSVARFPGRHAAWQACEELARLRQEIDKVEAAVLASTGKAPGRWVQAYAAADGWHWLDRRYRRARHLLRSGDDDAALERAAQDVLGRYEAVLETMSGQLSRALASAGWQIDDVAPQTAVFSTNVAPLEGSVAYILADALRYEMGWELRGLLKGEDAVSVQLQPAVACLPTITEVGMAALLPGADRSFSIQETNGGVAGAIDGLVLASSSARMDHARAKVPGLVDLSLSDALELSSKQLKERVSDAPIVIIRSQEIDTAGESLPPAIVQKLMGTVLEDLRSVVLRLAAAGIRRVVIAADHGHLFGRPKGEEMRVPRPEGGETVLLHRRCWMGRGGTTPGACERVSASDLGYPGCDLDLVVPRGTAVLRSGGSLAYHHGGASLQELVIPVLTVEMPIPEEARAKKESPVVIEQAPKEITNAIFSVQLRRTDLPMDPIELRVIAISTEDNRVVGQARFANMGWDDERGLVVLSSGDPMSVGIQLEDEEAAEVRVRVIEVGTDRVMKESEPIPVDLLR